MNHLTEEQLILHYYGEDSDAAAVERHLESCAECRSGYGSLVRVLNLVDGAPVPERGESYGREVWARLKPAVGVRPRWWAGWLAPRRWAAVAAMAALALAAFLAGRYSPRTGARTPVAANMAAKGEGQVRERILLVAVGDHLERSQMVLVELMNARPDRTVNVAAEKELAQDLVSENRLYRQTAAGVGEQGITSLLEELERVLLDIARGPAEISGAELESLRKRIEAEGLLFKIRVAGSNVQKREIESGKTL